LAGSAFANSPIFPLSSLTGEGVAALREHLFSAALAQPERAAGGRFRLAVDRSFTLDGVGTVATGTALAGAVAVGDELLAFPLGARVRVRDLRVQDETAAQGRVGQRCALALRGVDKQALRRGAWLVDPALNFPVSRFQAELRVPARHEPLKHMQRVHVHLGTDDIVGRVSVLSGRQIESGASGYVEILLERSCLALHGDRFVLRDAGARRTVGGGRVLDIHPPARHKRTPERLASLKAASTLDAKQALAHLLETSATGVELEPFSLSWNLTGDELGSLHAANLPIYTEGKSRIALAPGRFEELQQRLLEILAQSHAEAPDLPGLEGGQLRRKLSPRLAAAVFDALVHALRRAGRLAQTRSWLHLPAHRAELSSDDRRAFARLRPLLDATPYNPPRVRAVARADGTPEYEVRRLFKRLARAGELYPVARDHYFTAEAVAELAVCVRRLNAEQGAARAAAFRDRIYPDGGGGRKVAIQILEFFDRIGYTRRVRDEHLLSTSEGQLLW
jgi:selenocysteine-specific elongation factor